MFAGRLMNPLDPFLSRPGEAAWDQFDRVTRRAIDTGVAAARDPRAAVQQIKAKAAEANRSLNPLATPMAPTLPAELQRSFSIGANQGELAFDIGTLGVGGAGLKGLRGVRAMPKEELVAKYRGQGFNPAEAAYLADPYPTRGMGHHFVPRSFEIPEKIGSIPLPKSIVGWKPPETFIESQFNVLKPKNISRGEMYELHHGVDDRFHYARMPHRLGGSGWSGTRLELERYGPAERLWRGSPAPLKVAAASPPAYGLLNYEAFLDGEGQR